MCDLSKNMYEMKIVGRPRERSRCYYEDTINFDVWKKRENLEDAQSNKGIMVEYGGEVFVH